MSQPHHDAGERWDRSDEKALRLLIREGLSQQAIALRLGRTVNAVRTRVYRLRKAGRLR